MTTYTASSGHPISDTVISRTGVLKVVNGGTATSNTITGGGTEYVSSGGTSSDTTVSSGGQAYVYASGTEISASVLLGGTENISAGGTALGTTIASGGYQYVYAGGIASNTALVGDIDVITATQLIAAGGLAIGTTMKGGGDQIIYFSGTASNATVSSGGNQYVSSGGIASGTTIRNSGYLTISSGGTAYATMISGGGQENVWGGTANATIVYDSGLEYVGVGALVGFTSGTTVNSGGEEYVRYGTADTTTVNSGGSEYVTYDDTYFYGTANNTTIAGGTLSLASSTEASGTIDFAENGGELIVSFGAPTAVISGFVPGDRIEFAGIAFNGTPASASVTTAGIVAVTADGQTYNLNVAGATVGETDFQANYANGSNVLITKNAAFTASGGQPISNTTVTGAEVLLVTAGGSASTNTLSAGGSEYVTSGGAAYGTTVSSGGYEYVAGSAFESNGNIAGGTLEIASGGSVSGGVTFTGSGGKLVIDSTAPTATISGFAPGDTIEFANVPYDSATDSLTVATAGVLTVDADGTFYNLDIAGAYVGESNFVLSGDLELTENAACFLRGTGIRTPRGDVAVQNLAIGDTVTTRSGEARPVKWIGRRAYAGAFAAANPALWPIRIRAGALGKNRPARDLNVSPEHAMFLDQRLIPAKHLVNGGSIVTVNDHDVIEYFHIEFAEHEVIFAEGAATESFVDCDSRGIFHNAAEYAERYPGERPRKWRFCAPVLEHGKRLEKIQRRLLARAKKNGVAPPQDGPLEGFLDGATASIIHGWARLPAHPGVPVLLEISINGEVIATILANQPRSDLFDAGIGDGRHGFSLRLPKPLDMSLPQEVRVRRVLDRAELNNSPGVVGASAELNRETMDAVTRLMEGVGARANDAQTADRVLEMLTRQTDKLRQKRAQLLRDAGPVERRRGGAILLRRALVIDAVWPQPDRDAGAQAIFEHMLALQRLGWVVSFTAKTAAAANPASLALLQAAGIICHAPPSALSVEEVLARQARCYQLVYLHRIAVAGPYTALVRHYQPQARIVFSVADLHYQRLSRQAAVESRPELLQHAKRTKAYELAAIRQADAVITHSPAEAALLAREATGVPVHVVPWTMRPLAARLNWGRRSGALFVANFNHAPNRDGLEWMVREVMMLVSAELPSFQLTVAGDGLPAAWRDRLAGPNLIFLGHVPDLAPLYAKARLAIAPLRFGAGVKGKVLEAWAHALPCVMTPSAAEGLPLGEMLPETVAADAKAFARLMVKLHAERATNERLRLAAQAVLRTQFNENRIDRALACAVDNETQLRAG